MFGRASVEVAAHRRKDPQAPCRCGDEVEEPVAGLVVGSEGEALLELVDDEHKAAAVVRYRQGGEVVIAGDIGPACCEAAQRVLVRRDDDDRVAGYGQLGQATGPDHRRLSRPRGAHKRDERDAGKRVQHLCDGTFPAMEANSVAILKDLQSLERNATSDRIAGRDQIEVGHRHRAGKFIRDGANVASHSVGLGKDQRGQFMSAGREHAGSTASSIVMTSAPDSGSSEIVGSDTSSAASARSPATTLTRPAKRSHRSSGVTIPSSTTNTGARSLMRVSSRVSRSSAATGPVAGATSSRRPTNGHSAARVAASVLRRQRVAE